MLDDRLNPKALMSVLQFLISLAVVQKELCNLTHSKLVPNFPSLTSIGRMFSHIQL